MEKNKKKQTERNYEFQSQILLENIVFARNRKKKMGAIEIERNEPKLDTNLYAFIKDCRLSNDRNYVILILDIYETFEPMELSFTYKNDSIAIDYLINNAKKFLCFRNTGNIVELVGHAALVKISKNQGYLNLKIIHEVDIKELDLHLQRLEKNAENMDGTIEYEEGDDE